MRTPPYLHTLGSTKLVVDGRTFPLKSREAALIAFLCRRAGLRTARTEIIQMFWPSSPTERGRHSFSQLLYALRTKIGHDVVVPTDDIVTVADVRVDFLELLKDVAEGKLAQAFIRYEGRFLPKDDLRSYELQDWRDRVEEDAAHAVANAVREHALSCADAELPHVLHAARLVLATHPHLVQAQIGMLEALARTGNTLEVERVHRQFAVDNDKGFPALPSPDAFIARSSPQQASTIGFVGREEEAKALQRSWEQAEAGNGQVVVLLGESGIGKTRLANHFLRRIALRGGATWIARCSAATQRLPYSVVAELLRDNRAGQKFQEGRDVLKHLEAMSEASVSGTDEYRHRLTELVTTLLERHAHKQPVAILIDDAQWADDYTALLLSYWSYRLRGHRALVLLTVRTQEADALPEWLAADLDRTVTLNLGPLGIDAASRIVQAFETTRGTSISTDLRDALIWKSGGRPFLLIECLATVLSNDSQACATERILSESAESMLRRRLRNLSSDASSVLGSLAVWGREISTDLLQRAVGLSQDRVATAVDTLHGRGIACWNRGNVSFAHDLMRETTYKHIPPATRALLHRKAAEQLGLENESPGRIADHYARAGDSRLAATHAGAAALDAFAGHCYSEYEYYCGMWMDYGDQRQRQEAADHLGKYLVHVGRVSEINGIRHLLSPDRPDHMLFLAIAELERELAAGRREAMELLSLARLIVQKAVNVPDVYVAPVLATLLDVALDAGSDELTSDIITALRSEVDAGLNGEARLAAESIEAVWHGLNGDVANALNKAEAIVQDSSIDTSPPTRAMCLSLHGTLLLRAGRVPEARSCFSDALAFATVAGDVRRQLTVCNNSAVALFEAGDTAAALQSLERVLTTSSIHHRVRGYGNAAILHYETGDLPASRRAIENVLALNATYRSHAFECLGSALHGLISLAGGDVASATSYARRVDQLSRRDYVTGDVSYSVALLCRIAVLQGRVDAAIAFLDEKIEVTKTRDTLCYLRLLCEKATVIGPRDADAAAVLGRHVKKAAIACGAALLAERAQSIVVEYDYRT